MDPLNYENHLKSEIALINSKIVVKNCEHLVEATDDLKHKLDAKIVVEENLLTKLSKISLEKDESNKRVMQLEDLVKNSNSKLAKTTLKHEKDKQATVKALKSEIKEWKKDLGTERKFKINLEKKLSKLEESKSKLAPSSPSVPSNPSSSNTSTISDINCYICAEPIPNYIPKFFHGNEINPACETCSTEFDDTDSKMKVIDGSMACHMKSITNMGNVSSPSTSKTMLPNSASKLPDPKPFPPFSRANLASKDLNSNTLFPPICQDFHMFKTVPRASQSFHDSLQVVVQDSKEVNVSDLDKGRGKLRTFP